MRYVEPIFRPGPTESNSYLLQVTIGCSHNLCTFCSFFKNKPFYTRPFEEIVEDLKMARQYYRHDPPVFLLDGQPTYLSMDELRPILEKIQETFPNSPHTNMYARFGDIYKNYTTEDIMELKRLNVKQLYTSLESGSDKVLRKIRKGNPQKVIFEAARRLNEAEMNFGGGIILGLGGVEDSEEHVRETIRVLNEIKPTSVGMMTLNPQIGTPLYEDIIKGEFELPTYRDILREEREILEGLEFERPTLIWAGGFLPGSMPITGYFPEDKEKILNAIRMRPFPERLLDEKLMLNGGL